VLICMSSECPHTACAAYMLLRQRQKLLPASSALEQLPDCFRAEHSCLTVEGSSRGFWRVNRAEARAVTSCTAVEVDQTVLLQVWVPSGCLRARQQP
jgi:hypothetical protein